MSNLISFAKSFLFSYTTQIFLLLNGLLYTYIIANYLGPDNYGLFIYLLTFVTNIVYLFGLESISETLNVFTAKYKSKKLFVRAFKYSYLIVFILFLGLLFLGPYFIEFVDDSAVSLLRVISFIVLLFPASLLYNSLYRGFKLFGKVLKIAVFENLSNLLLAFIFVIVFDLGVIGVVYAKIISLAIAVIVSVFYSSQISFEDKNFENKTVVKYAKISFFTTFVKRIVILIQLFFIGLFISPVLMGFYYLLEKFSNYAIRIPSASINEVFIPYLGEKADNLEVLSNYISLNFKALFALSFSIGTAIFFIAPFIITVFFPGYVDSIYLIPYFTLTIFASGFTGFGNIYRILNRNDLLLNISFVSLFNTVIFGYLLISNYGVVGLILINAVRQFLSFPFHYVFLKRLGIKMQVLPTKNDLILLKRLFSSSLSSLRGKK